MAMQSVFDIFRIGIGPSSSHTMGPMKAALRFLGELEDLGLTGRIERVRVDLHGSLALTGRGHMTDRAVILGLAGEEPETVDLDGMAEAVASVQHGGCLPSGFSVDIDFIPEPLPRHENGMTFRAMIGERELLARTYYSIGGGFIVGGSDPGQDQENLGDGSGADGTFGEVPYPFASAEELLSLCHEHALSVSTLVLENEHALHPGVNVAGHFERVWGVMTDAMERGMRTEGVLPGGLHVPRRAAPLLRMLNSSDPLSSDPMKILDWVNLYALAASEENAAGGRVVTAPTSGACGVIPAVVKYYDQFVRPLSPEERMRFFLAAGAVGLLYRTNASISGAEVGCQGEVGVACSMAAAGLTELSGRSPRQVATAAEIAMEHCLGMTCDPIAGLVQVPCIERNAIAAVKAINAARLARRRAMPPLITLDEIIRSMYETGKDMDAKYRETARGGLARVHCG